MQTPHGRGRRGISPALLLVGGGLFLAACADDAPDTSTITARAELQVEQVFGLRESLESGGSEFGHSVAIGDELIAVGDPQHDTVHVYRAEAGDFTRVTALEGTLADAGFGRLVAISGDAVIVAYDDDVQQVEAWAPDGGSWSTRAVWRPDFSEPGAKFGSALYADDDTVIIGAPGPDSDTSSGGRVFVLEGAAGEHQNWQRHVLSQQDPQFGKAVGYDGRWLAVGIENAAQGGAMVFERYGLGDWSAGELLTVLDADDTLGHTVAVADNTVFVGFPHADERSAVHAFERIENAWSRTQTFESDAGAEHHFGSAIAATGGVLAIGSRYNNEPVRYFRREGATWVEAGSLAEPIEFEKTHLFGWALATDGTRLLVGSTGPTLVDSPPARGQGRVHVYLPGFEPEAPDEQFIVYEDTPLDFELAARDPEGDELNYKFSGLAVGRLARTESGWRYEPGNNWHGTDSFSYTVTDSLGLSSTGRLTFDIRPVNDPPVVKDEYLDCIGVPCEVVTRLHTADVDGDRISDYEIVERPSHGRAEIRRGTLTYELDEHPGTPRVSFVIRVSDGMFWSEPAVVDIIIEDAPNAANENGTRVDAPRPDDASTHRAESGCSSVDGRSSLSGWILLVAFAICRRRR